MMQFKLYANYKPTGDQPEAISKLVNGLNRGYKYQTLLGVTGSGKTFSMAKIIEKVQKPTIVISHNKTLAAQLYREFKEYFPKNAIEYFVSYYSYYQPEAYIPRTDTYIEKDSSVNEEIDKMRLSATVSLMTRRDVIIVASVSCIYGLGSPENYQKLILFLKKGEEQDRSSLMRKLITMQYDRNDIAFERGKFRVRGDVIDIFPSYYGNKAIRVEFFGDKIDQISEIDVLKGEVLSKLDTAAVYPARHYVIPNDNIDEVISGIESELEERLKELRNENKLLEAQRLEQRTRFDLEMIKETGYCSGVENYSRYFSNRKRGTPPYTLLDYFPKDYLMFIDESHVSIPQIRGMYFGDKSRKDSLIEYGFRLPSAWDNRPLRFDEFESKINQVIFVSATPAEFELKKSKQIAELVVRPTGLIEPEIIVRPIKGQIDDVVAEIKRRVERNERVLVTTLTKRMAEELTDYIRDLKINARYLHSEIDTIERTEILRGLRLGSRQGGFDVLVGINLLREGLDLPEVSLVCILDADKPGYLRSEIALIQTAGRASRNLYGQVIMYADEISTAMEAAIKEINRRRQKQIDYNKKYNIKPRTIIKPIQDILYSVPKVDQFKPKKMSPQDIFKTISYLESEMRFYADNLEFEKAAVIRDKIIQLKDVLKQKNR
ncbi:MAG: excinuclease ABC subunit UvrB [Candidatus Helarchaeota archaeon]